MKRNMGIIDRVIRIIFAILILELFRTGRVLLTDGIAVFLGILTVFFIATGFLSYCPLYALFNMSTAGNTKPGAKK